jgi:hypothetical protein
MSLGNILLWIFICASVAVGFGAAPISLALLLHFYPATWPEELQHYQALAGALVALFAASLGIAGVLLTIRNQRSNVLRQIEAQRQERIRERDLARRQVASAFIGEIETLIQEIQDPFIRPALITALDSVKSGPGLVRVATVRIAGRFTPIFDSNPGNVGLFPTPIPENLARLYSRFEAIRVNLDHYSDAAEAVAQRLASPDAPPSLSLPMTATQITILLRGVLVDLSDCVISGTDLMRELATIRDAALP